MYVISANDTGNNFQVTVYELKDSSIKDIFNSKKIFNINILVSGLNLKFTDAPEDLQADHNKLWLKVDQTSLGLETGSLKSNFIGYINTHDMSFKSDISSVKFPVIDKFPQFGYTMDKITNEYGSALYSTGGVVYSKRLGAYISSNSFFKYNYTTLEWVDMTSKYRGKLDPIYNHKSAVMDNRYLVLFDGKIAKDPTKETTLNINEDGLFKDNSIYNLKKFDIVTNIWESISLNTSMFDSSVASLQFTELSVNFYNNRVLTLGGLVASNENKQPSNNRYLGILDFKENQWRWSPVLDEGGDIFNRPILAKFSLIYNDQIILISDHSSINEGEGFQVFNLTSQRMQSTLKFTKSDTANLNGLIDQSSVLPAYAITLISVSCTVLIMLIIFFIYLKYNRNNATLQNLNTEPKKSMEAIWSNPEDLNMEYIIYGIKDNDSYFNSDTKYSVSKLENPIVDKVSNTQGYFTSTLGSTNISRTL
ncbi:hypothetical protein CONCODRAFT_12619 [Conidiobolus coronatus NRRL 28638]|uniref:Galactose oxidase n=1 Tax=Conidiobolus coronatus (strain ATCC 28846 / CBS 209.66 / NRRL 28638) TaxID=796925 RepID=A0A137NSH2_CONC2|nr:hypothetical protein CONCODRAFT_12619 [Conidiobolus coronatus NRRL 28638]|eukprot:KXN65715.1 hypothetical protein CONCODRAFT_12619 [Conidiobolus coronatus NRRL 28638]